MLRQIPRQTTLSLLEQLTPSLITRARAFSQPVSVPRVHDGPQIHKSIRDKIMAQTQSRRVLPTSTKSKYNTTLAEIGMALHWKDLTSALKLWQDLEQHRRTLQDRDTCRLPDSTIKDLHNLFVSYALSNSGSPEDALISTDFAEEFALYAAIHHSADALAILMLHYIKLGQPQVVLRFYEKYRQALSVNGIARRQTNVEANSPLALLEEEGQEMKRKAPGQASVLIAVVAAHAMSDSFREALDICLESGISIRKYSKQQFLRLFRENGSLLQKLESYLDRLDIASLVARPPLLSRHIMSMSYPQTASHLTSFYRKVLEGILGPDPYLAANPSAISEERVVAMTESGWTSFQTAFIRCERIDLAAKMWDDLEAVGITPGVPMWTGLLDTYADLRNSKQAMATWNMMLQQDILPDHLSYRAIISVLFDDNMPTTALDRFKEYQKILDNRSEQVLPVYNTVLRGLLRINRCTDAIALLKDMKDNGPKPDLFTYNTFLGYYARQKDFRGLGDVLSQMSTANIQGDVVTFSTILTALLAVGRKDAPTTIMNLMRKQGIKPNVATYTAVIDSQMREQTLVNLEGALGLLEKMEHDEGIKPNEVTYTSILSGLYRGRWIPREKADMIRNELVARMQKQEVTFRLPTYHILLRAALDSDDEMGHLDALNIIKEMKKNGIPRVGNTWFILLAGLMKRDLWDIAYDVVGEILGSGHEPNGSLSSLIADIQKQYRMKIHT